MKHFTKIKTIIVLAAIFLAFACGDKKNGEGRSGEPAGTIQIDGSSTVYPITEAVAEEFRVSKPEIKVTVGLSGTGGGFKKFSRGEIDINNASRAIKKEEADLCASNGIEFTEIKVAFDGLAVVANPQNDWLASITVEELKRIWSPEAQGKIMKWNQIRPEWPDKEIHLFGPGVESGTYDYFTEAIVGKSHSSRGDFTASEDDNVLVQGVSTDKYALGFFGLAYFQENQDKLKLIGVDDNKDENGPGPIFPTLETVKNGTYAPLSRPLFIYVTNKALQRNEVRKFVNFYLDAGPTLISEIGYIPLTNEEYESELLKVKKVTEPGT